MLSEKPWQTDAVLRLATGLMLGLTVISSLGLLLHKFSSETTRENLSVLDLFLSTLSFQVLALALVHFFLRRHQTSWTEFLGIGSRHSRTALWIGLLSGLCVLLPALALKQLSALALPYIHLSPADQAPVQLLRDSADWQQFVRIGCTAILLAPVVEESLFRGILYSHLKQCGHPSLGLWISSLLFAAIHANLATFIPLTFLALCLVWVYERADNLLAPIVCHALFNAINFVLLILQIYFFPEHSSL